MGIVVSFPIWYVMHHFHFIGVRRRVNYPLPHHFYSQLFSRIRKNPYTCYGIPSPSLFIIILENKALIMLNQIKAFKGFLE